MGAVPKVRDSASPALVAEAGGWLPHPDLRQLGLSLSQGCFYELGVLLKGFGFDVMQV